MRNKQIIVNSIFLLIFTFTASGQKLVNSPYSRFNIGTLEPAGSFRSLGMGGLSVSLRDNSSIFFSNPASYSSFDTTSFLFDFGLDASINKISDGKVKYTSDDINFDHLLMGFPLTRGWGFAVGVVPISNGYYKMYDIVGPGHNDYNQITGGYASLYSGEGGYNTFFIGSGIKINKNISAGINMNILFGEINRFYTVDFTEFTEAGSYNNRATERLRLGGVNFDYGLQYYASLKDDHFINAGLSLTGGKNYNSDFEQLYVRYTSFGSSDTLTYVQDNVTTAFIPGTLRLGISWGKKDKFVLGLDFITSKWSESRIPGTSGYAADTKSLLFGAEIIPEKYSNYSMLKRLEYRLGGHIGNNYFIYTDMLGNKEQLKEYGASFGIGIPMRRSLSKTNLFVDYTKKYGPSSGNLHTENYFTFGISLNLYDFWFVKRKYD